MQNRMFSVLSFSSIKLKLWQNILTENRPPTPFLTSLVVQMVKRLPTMWSAQVRSVGREDPLGKEMAAHSSTLAWEIPWTKSVVGYSPWGHKDSNMTSLHFTIFECAIGWYWRRKWQPTPVSLPGESHGWRSLVGYSPRGCKELDTTERLN